MWKFIVGDSVQMGFIIRYVLVKTKQIESIQSRGIVQLVIGQIGGIYHPEILGSILLYCKKTLGTTHA